MACSSCPLNRGRTTCVARARGGWIFVVSKNVSVVLKMTLYLNLPIKDQDTTVFLFNPVQKLLLNVSPVYPFRRPDTIHLNPTLYQNYQTLQQNNAFRDITQGTNGAYNAGPGWDACSGLGSPNGTNLANELYALLHQRQQVA